ncbi:hypothetical protein [Magnetovibrio sp.]|uniref:hypothetical protein n=1 Tax=Magnetovibrio sp. TaxID=2024836 RepID=UPI002F95BA81
MTDETSQTQHDNDKHQSGNMILMTLKERWDLQCTFYKAGVIAALYDALQLARDSGQSPPEWAIEGALAVVGERLKFGFTIGKGAKGNELSNYQKNMSHFRRWQVVQRLRSQGIKWDDVFIKATKYLKDTFAEAGPSAIQKSYSRVQSDLKDPEKALQYYSAFGEVQELTDTPNIPLKK